MGKQTVLAYSVAGVAVAIAIAVVAVSTLGITISTGATARTFAGAVVDGDTVIDAATGQVLDRSMLEQATQQGPVEYVYVDDPQSGDYDDDDRHDDDHDHRELAYRGEHDDDDD